MISERPLDPPEAPGCEYCNPESVDGSGVILVCGHPEPQSTLLCTRAVGHDDAHAYCISSRHPLRTWSA